MKKVRKEGAKVTLDRSGHIVGLSSKAVFWVEPIRLYMVAIAALCVAIAKLRQPIKKLFPGCPTWVLLGTGSHTASGVGWQLITRIGPPRFRLCCASSLSSALCLVALGNAPQFAHADIYSFTDSQGVTHFSNVPTDSRFELLLAAPEALAPGLAKHRDINWLAQSARYDAVISGAAEAAEIQPALVRAVIAVESGFNPRAVSRKGAIGLMQLQPSTAKRYGVKDLYDPEQNIRAGASYLGDLLLRFHGDLELALAAYNAGENAVERYGRHIPPYVETMRYVPDVMRVYHHLVQQSDKG